MQEEDMHKGVTMTYLDYYGEKIIVKFMQNNEISASVKRVDDGRIINVSRSRISIFNALTVMGEICNDA